MSIQLHETVRKNASKSGCHTSNEIEYSVSLLKLKTWVPCTEEIDAAGIETSLEATKNDTEDSHCLPALDKAKALKGRLARARFRKDIGCSQSSRHPTRQQWQ
jgi:hypothetical protein